MTVSAVYNNSGGPTVICNWFNDANELQSGSFFTSCVYTRFAPSRSPIIPNPGETYEDAAIRRLERKSRS